MSFEEILDQAMAMLQRRGRVTYRALKLQFSLDDDRLEALKGEILYAHPHVVNDDGRSLIWTGEGRPPPTPVSPPGIDQEPAPLSYTPAHLTEKILDACQSLQGERKQVTVLFADLKGSMELLADRDPEEARQLLDPVLERMMAAVHRYEGTVNQVLGDGIMALCGAPIAHENYAVQACYLAQILDIMALVPLAEFGRIEGYLREAERLARTLDDQRRLGWVSAYMCSHHLMTGGHASQVRTSAQRVEAIGETLGDVPLQVAAQYYLLTACHLSGDYRGTEHVCRRLMQSVQGERTRERFGLAQFPSVQSRGNLARALAERGVFDEGDAHGHEAVRIAEALDHPFSLVWACLGLAYLDSLRGELRQAAGLLERAVAQCRDWNITFYTPIATASLGHVYAWSGRLEEGISLLQQGLTAFESADIGFFHSISVVQLGEAYLLADRVEDARACADYAVRLARERGERGHEAWALRLLGDTASHHDRPDVATAEAHYGAAMALADELGMRPLQAHCHRGLGTLYATTGPREQACAELSTAIDLYRTMDMTFWLAQAEAALAQVEGR